MPKEIWTNYAISELAAAVADTADSLHLKAGDGIMFPNPGPGEFFRLTLAGAGVFEVVLVQARNADVLSGVSRGQEGTMARAWPANTAVMNTVTAGAVAAMARKKASGFNKWGF